MLDLLDAVRWQDWAGNACYALLAMSYLFTNMLWLRVIAIVSLAFEGVYFLFGADSPLWVGIGWNMVFVVINLVMLLLLLRERRHLQLDADAAILRRGLLAELDPASFGRLLKAGEWVELPQGTRLTTEGVPVEHFYVIADGLAEVDVRGNVVSILQNGAFVGEMSLMTNAPASATVTTIADCRVFRLDRTRLDEMLGRYAELRAGLDRTIGRDLARKLRTASVPPASAV